MKDLPTRGQSLLDLFQDWALPRQLAGENSESTASKSRESKALRPRVEDADAIGTGVCPYCAVGCSQLIYAKSGRIIHIEGDPRSPINQGTLCPKGAATFGWITSERRLNKVLYRAPHSDRWSRSRSIGRWTGSPRW